MVPKNSRKFAKLIKSILLLVCSALTPKLATAATLRVGTCPGANFSTIQAAVNASASGDTVQVCPGIYPEQVIIKKGLNLIGIQSGNADAAVVISPAGGMSPNVTGVGGPIAAGIAVISASPVSIANVVVDGSNNQIKSCGVDLVGIFFQNASGSIKYVVTRNQKLATGLAGC
jgi:pectin methylesterase-like acyl-CoA thioesterase